MEKEPITDLFLQIYVLGQWVIWLVGYIPNLGFINVLLL